MDRAAYIDLSNGNIRVHDGRELHKEFLGGVGVNSALLHQLVPPSADPLGPENALIFGVGGLVGTMLPTASRTELTAKSPLSGRFGTANCGGFWGVNLKFAGYSHLIFQGKSSAPVYVLIDEEDIRLEDAGPIWGLDTWSTVDYIRSRHGEDFQVASIGPAGEKLVRFAAVISNYDGAWGRTGLGAVMGSKNLKAVAVRGHHAVEVADPRAFASLMRRAFATVTSDASYGYTHRYGSMVISDPYNQLGALPGHNFTTGFFPDWSVTRGRKYFVERYKVKSLACFSCPIACMHWSRVPDGYYRGDEARGVEITFTLEFGAKLGLQDIGEILQCAELCNRYGMDVCSAATVTSFAIEANHHGLLGAGAAEVPNQWGDFPGIYRLLESIGRREGIGDRLAEGVKRCAALIPGSQRYAMHVKGVELPVRDPRAKWDVWTLGYLTNTRGGDHLRTRSPVEMLMAGVRNHLEEELGVTPEAVRDLDMPEKLKKEIFGDPPDKVDIPKMAVYSEDLITLINSAGLCIRPPVLRSLGPNFYAQAFKAVTGFPYTAEEMLAIAGKIWSLQHDFNVQAGEDPGEYCFPDRFYEEALVIPGDNKPPLSQEQVAEAVAKYMIARRHLLSP